MSKSLVRIPLTYLGGCYQAPEPNPVWTVPETTTGEVRGDIKTYGPWGIPVSYKALAMSCEFGDYSTPKNAKAYGVRTLSNVRESGHVLEGTVSVGGRKYRGFTSSALFQRPDGSLVDVEIIHVCIPTDKEVK